MKGLFESAKDLVPRQSSAFGPQVLLPLVIVTVFCFGYSEFKMHSQGSVPARAPIPVLSAGSAKQLEDIPLATQSQLPSVNVNNAANAAAPALDSSQTSATQSQVPDGKAVSNPQASPHVTTMLQNTISQELYLSTFHGDNGL